MRPGSNPRGHLPSATPKITESATPVRGSLAHPAADARTNVEGTVNVLSGARAAGLNGIRRPLDA